MEPEGSVALEVEKTKEMEAEYWNLECMDFVDHWFAGLLPVCSCVTPYHRVL